MKEEEMSKLIDNMLNPKPHRIPYENWANSQLSIAKYYGGCILNGKHYVLDYENCRKKAPKNFGEDVKYFPDLVEVVKGKKVKRNV